MSKSDWKSLAETGVGLAVIGLAWYLGWNWQL